MADIADNVRTTAVLETTLDGNTGTYSGLFESSGDHDWIRVTLQAGETYSIFLSDQVVGSSDGDSFLTLRDEHGVELDSSDDAGLSDLNSFLAFTPTTTGTYYLDVSDFNSDRGAYSVFMTSSSATNVFLDDTDNVAISHAGERIAGGAGNDTIVLDNGGFDAVGEQGNDVLSGNDAANILSGGLGNDLLLGHGGDDLLFGDAGDDDLDGGAGNDQLFGGDGLDNLFGGLDNDRLSGGADADELFGEEGNDTLNGGAGADHQDGGIGDDTFVISGTDGLGDSFAGGDGVDTLKVAGTSAVTLAGFNAAASSIEQWDGNGKGVMGTSAADVFDLSGLTSKTGLPFVDAGAGNDTLIGSKFADTLIGGTGHDTLSGGLGADLSTSKPSGKA